MGWREGVLKQSDPGRRKPVAQYVRMSTDHQRYSTENQRDAISKYAAQHRMDIVQTYADEGRSGLSLEGRDALKRLIQDVQVGKAGFEAILVYDISRWGRFQDADESAYYEYLCRRKGIQVFYCAEPFENDGSPMATIMKSVKRAMAGEYSRELSHKVFHGQCRLIELGFRQGGPPGFGLRRMLLDEHRNPKGPLSPGEQKSLQTDRVVLTPGPSHEVELVRHIYHEFLEGSQTERNIADALNAKGLKTDRGRTWTRGTVHQVLTNEKYIGNNVYNRTSFKLKLRHVRNSSDMWVRCDGAFEAIVPQQWFSRAQEIIASRCHRFDDAMMLNLLEGLYKRHGILSGLLIDEQDGMPSSSMYRTRFGGLARAYALIGFVPKRDYRYLEINRTLRELMPSLMAEVMSGFDGVSAEVERNERTDLLTINDEFTLSIVIARCQQLPSGSFRWRLRFDCSLDPDITLAIRLAADQASVLDYYLFPRIDRPMRPYRVAEQDNEVTIDAYRFVSLDPLYALARRLPLSRAA